MPVKLLPTQAAETIFARFITFSMCLWSCTSATMQSSFSLQHRGFSAYQSHSACLWTLLHMQRQCKCQHQIKSWSYLV